MRLIVLLIALFAATQSVVPARAQTTVTNSFGGNGGGPFRLDCPSGMAMTGIRARAGAWLDSVAPVCAIWVNHRTLGEIDDQPATGGGGGGASFIRCQGPIGAVVGIAVQQANNGNHTIGHLLVDCGRYTQPWLFWNKLPGSADYLGKSNSNPSVTLQCGIDEVAVGLYGRSGAFIDKIGLLCASSPAATPILRTASNAICRNGLVHRMANRNDIVCVSDVEQQRTLRETGDAAQRVQPGGGSAGPATCRAGYVWREANIADLVCVSTERRAQVKAATAQQFLP